MGLFRKHKKTVTVSQNNKYLGFTPDELTVIETFLKRDKEDLIDELNIAREVSYDPEINPLIDTAIVKLQKMRDEEYQNIEVMILG